MCRLSITNPLLHNLLKKEKDRLLGGMDNRLNSEITKITVRTNPFHRTCHS